MGIAGQCSATVAGQLYFWHYDDEAPRCICYHLPHLHYTRQQTLTERSLSPAKSPSSLTARHGRKVCDIISLRSSHTHPPACRSRHTCSCHPFLSMHQILSAWGILLSLVSIPARQEKTRSCLDHQVYCRIVITKSHALDEYEE